MIDRLNVDGNHHVFAGSHCLNLAMLAVIERNRAGNGIAFKAL